VGTCFTTYASIYHPCPAGGDRGAICIAAVSSQSQCVSWPYTNACDEQCHILLLLLLLQVRLTFKPESQQLWIASNTTTQKREWTIISNTSLISESDSTVATAHLLQWLRYRTAAVFAAHAL
jgi:hypothetical protein